MPDARIAYVLKAYPRASEPFILSEIHRLETLGLPLRLFATKPAEAADRFPRHPVIDRIQATPEFLTPTASTSWKASSIIPKRTPSWSEYSTGCATARTRRDDATRSASPPP